MTSSSLKAVPITTSSWRSCSTSRFQQVNHSLASDELSCVAQAIFLQILRRVRAFSNISIVLAMVSTSHCSSKLAVQCNALPSCCLDSLPVRSGGWSSPQFFAQYFPSQGIARLAAWRQGAGAGSGGAVLGKLLSSRGHHQHDVQPPPANPYAATA